MLRLTLIALLLCPAALGACGDPQATVPRAGATPGGDDIPALLEIVCHKDGSTELLNDEVQTSPDGVHIRVDNRAGEFVSLNGAGLDFSEGVSEQVATSEPGVLKEACWPGSKHGGPEPERFAVQIHDVNNYWVPVELECEEKELGQSVINEFVIGAVGEKGNPEDIARANVNGLAPGDKILTAGYPKAESRQVAVVRDEKTIANLSYIPAKKGGWLLGSYDKCASRELNI